MEVWLFSFIFCGRTAMHVLLFKVYVFPTRGLLLTLTPSSSPPLSAASPQFMLTIRTCLTSSPRHWHVACFNVRGRESLVLHTSCWSHSSPAALSQRDSECVFVCVRDSAVHLSVWSYLVVHPLIASFCYLTSRKKGSRPGLTHRYEDWPSVRCCRLPVGWEW